MRLRPFTALLLAGALAAAAARAAETSERVVFAHLDDYADMKNGKEPHGIFADSAIAPALERLVGPAYPRFKECLGNIELGVKDVDGLGARVFMGGVAGLFTIMEAIVVLHPDGRIWAAVIDSDTDTIRYFTNDATRAAKLPETIRTRWMKSAAGAPRLDEAQVVFMSAPTRACSVAAEKAHFFKTPDAKAQQRAYVVRGDAVDVFRQAAERGGFTLARFNGKKPTIGFVKTAELRCP